ncbi:MAG: AAA family ATPase [Candidatus Heimdallarchaeota archaeon]
MISDSIPQKVSSVFEDFNYRDYEYELLLTSFRGVLTNPGGTIARVILIGPPGSGKSYILNNFQAKIQKRRIKNRETNFQLKCINVNCTNHASTKTVVLEIIQKIDPYFYANVDECQTAELQYILADILLARKVHLIVIFDNIDNLVEKEPEEVNSLIYGFQRFSEGKNDTEPNLFSQILVARELEFIVELDRSVFRKITTDVIPFEPYTAEQTFQLINTYVNKKVKRKIAEETIWFIALIARGNMRLALELIKKANHLAGIKHSIAITPEHIRAVNKKLTDFHITKQMLEDYPIGYKLMLLTIARRFKSASRAFLNFLDLPSLYISICEEYNQMKNAKYFSDVLNDLEKIAIISLHNVERDIFLTLSDIPANQLAMYLEKNLKQKRRDKPYFL